MRKLKPQIVKQIRMLYRNGISQRAIARKLGVGLRTVIRYTTGLPRKKTPTVGMKLPPQTIATIKRLYRNGTGSTLISKILNVSLQTVWKYTRGIKIKKRLCPCRKKFTPLRTNQLFHSKSCKNSFHAKAFRKRHFFQSKYIGYIICPKCGLGGSLVAKTMDNLIIGFVIRHVRNRTTNAKRWECYIG